MPEYFPDITLDPAPGHGASDLFTYSNPEPWLQHTVYLPNNQKTFGNELVNGTG